MGRGLALAGKLTSLIQFGGLQKFPVGRAAYRRGLIDFSQRKSMNEPSVDRETTGELAMRSLGALFLIAAGFIELMGLASDDPPPIASMVFLILGGIFMIYSRLTQIARLLSERR